MSRTVTKRETPQNLGILAGGGGRRQGVVLRNTVSFLQTMFNIGEQGEYVLRIRGELRGNSEILESKRRRIAIFFRDVLASTRLAEEAVRRRIGKREEKSTKLFRSSTNFTTDFVNLVQNFNP